MSLRFRRNKKQKSIMWGDECEWKVWGVKTLSNSPGPIKWSPNLG